jgi:phosphate:Na+ symporter
VLDAKTIVSVAGALALVLLGMAMMTEGLKSGTGQQIKRLLERSTSTVARGIFTGMATTAVVQSSGAVTVVVIGFVNAGVMNLRQALGVIYGTNIGTTMTAWIVALLGFGLKIDLLALALLAVGVGLRLSSETRLRQGVGEALAGFGLFFLGIGLLQESLGSLAAAATSTVSSDPSQTPAGAAAISWGWPLYLILGFVATVLVQSSSASIALILSAAAGGLLDFQLAASAVIGANLGSTSTAVLAALRATSHARRLALGHVIFNLLAAVVALLMLPWLVGLVLWLADGLQLGSGMATSLALFHTTFNLLGLVIILPFTERLADWLSTRFRQADEDLARPRFVDRTLIGIPALAERALHQELLRYRCLLAETVGSLTRGQSISDTRLEAFDGLGHRIEDFVNALTTQRMPIQEARQVADLLRVFRYLSESMACLTRLRSQSARPGADLQGAALDMFEHLREAARSVAVFSSDALPSHLERVPIAQRLSKQFEDSYELAKQTALDASARGETSIENTGHVLDWMAHCRRMIEQLLKADVLLAEMPRR